MPAIQSKSNFIICKDENIYPELSMVERLELHCLDCGNHWIIPVPTEMHDYRGEAQNWKNAYLSIAAKINDLMQYTETHYSMNPHKDKLMDMLDDLRKQIGEHGDYSGGNNE